MTRQQEADMLLELWRMQRQAGIRPENRRLPERKETA